jgi:phage shock protein PspC (stress-responsive transcriptional regulator)
MTNTHTLYRSHKFKNIGGVCAGIALSKNYPISLIRVLALILFSATAGLAIILYVFACLLMPTFPEDKEALVLPADPLQRSSKNKIVGGVCAGLAQYFGWDSFIVRILFIALIIFAGLGIIPYIYAWIILPKDFRA